MLGYFLLLLFYFFRLCVVATCVAMPSPTSFCLECPFSVCVRDPRVNCEGVEFFFYIYIF